MLVYGPDRLYFKKKQKNNSTKSFNLLFSAFWKKKEIKHNKHINNQNQEAFIVIITNYIFRGFLLCLLCKIIVFFKIPTLRIKQYYFYFSDRLTLFFRFLSRRPKKVSFVSPNVLFLELIFVCSFSFLWNWSTRSYPAIFASFRIA